MTLLSYPAFVEGQTLTRDDLNGLRDYLRDRDRTLARAVGFGIASGLVVAITDSGSVLHVTPGLAIDQLGEALMLGEEQIVPVPPGADDASFDFVAGQDGFTLVLVRTDHVETSTPCTEAGCNGHSELHDAGVDLLVVAGQLVADHPDFSSEPLLTQVTPLTLTVNGAVSGAFVGLRNALTSRIGSRLDPALAGKLADLTLDSADLPAVKAYKAAFLNQVLFATLDLLRFEALMSQVTIRETETPGVALGWLHQSGGAWVWDCSFRHEWEPATGLTLALLGGSCSDPGLPWLQKLESLIDTFTLPPLPAPADPPKPIDPGGVHLCKDWRRFGHRDCTVLVYPPLQIDPDWGRHWIDPGDSFKYPPAWTDPIPDFTVYQIDPADTLDTGALDLLHTFGTPAADAANVLTEVVQVAGVTPAVDVVGLNDVRAIEGFQYTGAAGPGDRIVLVQDTLGKVVATGRVPAGQTMRDLGTTLPAAVADAAAAQRVATGLQTDVAGLHDSFSGLDETVGQFGRSIEVFTKFQDETSTWQSGVKDRLAGLSGELRGYADQRVADLQVQMSAQLPGLVNGAVQDIRGQLAETIKRTEGIGGQLDIATTQLQQTAGRVDSLYSKGSFTGIKDTAVNTGLVDMLRTMRGSVEAIAPDNQRDAVAARMASVDDGLARLDAAAASGGSALADSPETLTSVVDGVVAGLQLAGAPAATIKTLQTQSKALRAALTQP